MKGKVNNRVLLIVFVILAAIFVITRYTSLQRSERSLRTDIAEIDTSQVSSMILYPRAENGQELMFQRKGETWTVAREGVTAPADSRSVTSTLAELQDLKAEQLESRSPDRWTEFQVDDSLGTRVVVKEGNKTTLDLVVGRFHYQPPPQGSYNPYGQSRVSGKTYIRLHDEDEVYSVDGFLAMSINQGFDRWRDQSVTRLNKSQVSKINFEYPADSGFIAEKGETGWMVAGVMADSASMATYLNKASRKSHSEFADGFRASGDPDFRVSFEGDNMKSQQVSAYIQPDSQLILNSSINPETWFRTDLDGLFEDLFPGSEELISGDDS